MIGRTVGKYRFIDQLGRGGMGTVYKALDETLDREVAIKVLLPELADSAVMKRFRAEATTLARLSHPDIATIYELYRADRDLLMVMEFVRGETLDALTDRCGPLPAERAAYLIDRVLGALEHAHRAGIVHRDMKPANVMVTVHGGVKVMDFGIARMAGAEHMTVDGYMMGTPAYMPPEQVKGDEVDGRADLYSAGVVLYRLLTGALPFKADTPIAMVQKQLAERPIPLATHRAGLPDWCEPLIQRALAKAPDERFQTAEEFRDALARSAGLPPPEQLSVAASDARTTPADGTARWTPPAVSTPSGAPAIPFDGATIVLGRQPASWGRPAIIVALLSAVILGVAALGRTSLPAFSAPVGPTPPPAPRSVLPQLAVLRPSAVVELSASRPVAAAVPPKLSRPIASAVLREAPDETATAAAVAPLPPPVRMETQVPLVFDARMLVSDGDKWTERDATLLFADRVTFTANNNLLESIPYGRVRAVSFSRGRQPLMNTSDGPEPVVKVGGPFSFLRGDRNWITFHTTDGFVVMRVDDDRLNPVLSAIEDRTGRRISRVVQ
jgi:serine/threonine protein kinase